MIGANSVVLVVRVADLAEPPIPAGTVTCVRCEARCWISEAGLELARALGAAPVCGQCFWEGR